MSALPPLAPCRLCGAKPREQDRFSTSMVRCGGCGLTVKQSALGENNAAERWNRLNAPGGGLDDPVSEVPLEMSLCEAASTGLRPERAYRFVVRAGCAKCQAWDAWNAYARGEAGIPPMQHPLLASFCNPGVRVVSGAPTAMRQRLA